MNVRITHITNKTLQGLANYCDEHDILFVYTDLIEEGESGLFDFEMDTKKTEIRAVGELIIIVCDGISYTISRNDFLELIII